MKTIVGFQLIGPISAHEGLAQAYWLEFTRFLTKNSATCEYQVEADLPGPQPDRELLDEATKVVALVRELAIKFNTRVSDITSVHVIKAPG